MQYRFPCKNSGSGIVIGIVTGIVTGESELQWEGIV